MTPALDEHRGFRSFALRYWIVGGAIFAVWLVASRWLVPWVIEIVHSGTGLPVVDGLLAGREHVSVEEYVLAWRAKQRLVTALLFSALLVAFPAWSLLRTARAPDADPSVAGAPRADAAPAAVAPSVVLLMVWVGLATGSLEGYFVATKAFYLGQIVPGFREVSMDSPWMIPLVHGALLGGVGFVLRPVLARRSPRTRTAVALGIAALLGLFSVIMATGWVAWWAALALASGIALRAGQFAADRSRELARLVLGTVAPMVAAPVLVAAVLTGLLELGEHRGLRDLPPARSDAPNVLLVVLDTERARDLSLHGYARPTTPLLDSLAGGGVVFDRAVSPGTWTLPSHAGIFTGRLRDEFTLEPSLETSHPTLAEVLRSRGYATAGFVANIYFCSSFYGIDRGFVVWRDQPRSPKMALQSTWLVRAAWKEVGGRFGHHRDLVRKTAGDVNREVLGWMDEAEGRPWFVFVNYFDAHAPYFPPPPFDTLFADAGAGRYWIGAGTADATNFSPVELTELRDRYDNGIAYVDHQLARLLSLLDARGRLENTLVVVTSDHGELFGEGGRVGHGAGLHLDLVHVPLVILVPGDSVAGVRIARPVSLRDLPSTVVGVTHPDLPSPFPGQSLARLWAGRETAGGRATEDTVVAENGGVKFVVTDRYHYSYRPDGGIERLFDLRDDPSEERDLATTAVGETVTASFRRYLRDRGLFIAPTSGRADGDDSTDAPWR